LDWDPYGKDDYLGTITLPLKLCLMEQATKFYPLENTENSVQPVTGQLELRFTLSTQKEKDKDKHSEKDKDKGSKAAIKTS